MGLSQSVVWLIEFITRITIHCYTQIINALGLSEKIFLCFSYSKSVGSNDSGEVPSFTPGT